MLKEAIQYVVTELAPANRLDLAGRIYTDKHVRPVLDPTPESLDVYTLDAIVNYLHHNKDGLDTSGLMIHVVSPERVAVVDRLMDPWKQRAVYMEAHAELPRHSFGHSMDVDEFLPYLKASFQTTEDRDKLLQIVGNIVEENSVQTEDDGITQRVTAKTGIKRVEDTQLPNPVALAPFCTFPEVDEQPQREFVFRMQKGPRCTLISADGNKWKRDAVDSIAAYLAQSFQEKLEREAIPSIIV